MQLLHAVAMQFAAAKTNHHGRTKACIEEKLSHLEQKSLWQERHTIMLDGMDASTIIGAAHEGHVTISPICAITRTVASDSYLDNRSLQDWSPSSRKMACTSSPPTGARQSRTKHLMSPCCFSMPCWHFFLRHPTHAEWPHDSRMNSAILNPSPRAFNLPSAYSTFGPLERQITHLGRMMLSIPRFSSGTGYS